MNELRKALGGRRRVTSQRRRGIALLTALVCLAVIVMLIGTQLRGVFSDSRAAILREHQVQAEWLADSGLDRAAAQLNADASYAGETWKPKIVDNLVGEVVITVSSSQQRRIVRVVAAYPQGELQQAVAERNGEWND
ncbi:MAG: hypothetical protein QGG36_08270 [Pirellulaceae bacterium]|jgi:Tfp pilus assembly protein PilX|nr:hypothetical protein [Pirellulaceae bacterium]MDP7015779.1 hypothetical protein [Pirellulaceae bacterium]